MGELEVSSANTAQPPDGPSSPPSSLSLGSALALIVPQMISSAVSVALVFPLVKQIPALWEAVIAKPSWIALVPPVMSSLLVLGVASKSGLRDLLTGLTGLAGAAKGLLPGKGSKD